jgi:hypothetical protein
MAQAEKKQGKSKTNPLIWVSIAVIGLILFLFLGSDRGNLQKGSLQSVVVPLSIEPSSAIEAPSPDSLTGDTSQEGEIIREPTVPAVPGAQARDLIVDLREKGKPYPLAEVMSKASAYVKDGNLADAHLAYFFAAREGNVEAMMTLAEMSDPTLFQPENNLLDQADPLQAYKWYKRALNSGFEPAKPRLDNLYAWAEAEAKIGNSAASQLLLNFR